MSLATSARRRGTGDTESPHGAVMKYRVNYGNGQVSETFKSLRVALAYRFEARKECSGAFLQFFDHDTQEWCFKR
jgi:hypothetical protein